MRSPNHDANNNALVRRSIPFPSGVRAAAIIWIGFAIVELFIAGLSIALNAAADAANAVPRGQAGISGFFMLMMSLAFLLIGIQTIKGSAKGTLGNGIWSIAMGLIHAMGTVFLIRAAGGSTGMVLIVASVSGLIVMAMLTGGLLAISGRHAYAEWRIAHGMSSRHDRRKATPTGADNGDRPQPAKCDDQGRLSSLP